MLRVGFNTAKSAAGEVGLALRACNSSPRLAQACVGLSGALVAKEAYDNYEAYQQGDLTDFGAVAKTAAAAATTVVPAVAALRYASYARTIAAAAVGTQNVGAFLATDAFRSNGGAQAATDRTVDTFAAVVDGVTRGSMAAAVVQSHALITGMGIPERARAFAEQMQAHAELEVLAEENGGDGFGSRVSAMAARESLAAPRAASGLQTKA